MTADELLALPPDGGPTRLIDGEIVLSDPTMRHQRLVGEQRRPGREGAFSDAPPDLSGDVAPLFDR